MTTYNDVYNSWYVNKMNGAPAPGDDPEGYAEWEARAMEVAEREADAWEKAGGGQAYDMLGYEVG